MANHQPARICRRTFFGALALFALLVLPPTGRSFALSGGEAEGKLLDETRDVDFVSPVGLKDALCAIRPAMSPTAAFEVASAIGNVCLPPSKDRSASVWIADAFRMTNRLAASISKGAELHREPSPLNSAVARWLQHHDVPPVVPAEPIVFASVSAVNYNASWIIPFDERRTRTRIFHGRDRETTTSFMEGTHGGWLDPAEGCRRVIIPTSGQGYVAIAGINRDSRSAIDCVERPILTQTSVSVDVTLPKLSLRSVAGLAPLLRRIGIKQIFDARRSPLAPLAPRLAVSELIQALAFRLDEKGVSVKATTIADVALSAGPRPRAQMVFDRPFVLRVVDARGSTIALGTVQNVR